MSKLAFRRNFRSMNGQYLGAALNFLGYLVSHACTGACHEPLHWSTLAPLHKFFSSTRYPMRGSSDIVVRKNVSRSYIIGFMTY